MLGDDVGPDIGTAPQSVADAEGPADGETGAPHACR
jgi:hypothetical protein